MLCHLLVLDLTAYSEHVANHWVALFWRFHSVHHSDEIFDASTAVRFHIGELLVSFVVRLFVVAMFGLPVVGILAFEIIYGFLNFFLQGNTRLPERFSRKLEGVFITPVLHRFHHSANSDQLNMNFGTIFSIWDRIFGTFAQIVSHESYKVGLPHPTPGTATLIGILKHPISKLGWLSTIQIPLNTVER